MRFNLKELSGSLGDLGLFIPLMVAVCISTDMNFAIVLIAAGIMNIATGILFNQPIPVQPMKAIAAVAIAEGLSAGQVAASGLLIGLILLALTYSGLLQRLISYIPKALIAGIQLGVGLKLMWLSIQWMAELNWSFDDTNSVLLFNLPGVSIGLLSLCVLSILLVSMNKAFPTLLIIFGLGIVLVYFNDSTASDFTINADWLLSVTFIWPSIADFAHSFWYAVLPQLPLTLLNSVIAICALSADYFPKKGVSTNKMASSVAWMNIVCSPLGALPMCHGASGLAAQYQFGARTGGSVVMLGTLKVLLGVFLGTSMLAAMSVYPKFILAPLLIIAGIALCKAGWRQKGATNISIVLACATGIIFVNTLVGFVIGLAVFASFKFTLPKS